MAEEQVPGIGIRFYVIDQLNTTFTKAFDKFVKTTNERLKSVEQKVSKLGGTFQDTGNKIQNSTKKVEKAFISAFGRPIDNAALKLRKLTKDEDAFALAISNLLKELKASSSGLSKNSGQVDYLRAKLKILKKTIEEVINAERSQVIVFKNTSKVLANLSAQRDRTVKEIHNVVNAEKIANSERLKALNLIKRKTEASKQASNANQKIVQSTKQLASAAVAEIKRDKEREKIKKQLIKANEKLAQSQRKLTERINKSTKTRKDNNNVINKSRVANMGLIASMKEIVFWQLKWFAGAGLVFGIINKVSQSFKGFFIFEDTMTRIATLFEFTTKQAKNFRTELIALSKTSLLSIEEITDAYLEVGRAIPDATMAMEVLTNAMKLQVVAGGELTEATEAIRIVLTVWGEEAGTVEEIANKLTFAFDKSALSTSDMATIFNTSANSAKQFGVSVDNLLAAMAGLRDAGIKAGTIGAGLNIMLRDLSLQSGKFVTALGLTKAQLQSLIPAGQSLSDIFRKLRDAGVSTNQVWAAMTIRGARIGVTIDNIIDKIAKNEVELKNYNLLQERYNAIITTAVSKTALLGNAFDRLVFEIIGTDEGIKVLLQTGTDFLDFSALMVKAVKDIAKELIDLNEIDNDFINIFAGLQIAFERVTATAAIAKLAWDLDIGFIDKAFPNLRERGRLFQEGEKAINERLAERIDLINGVAEATKKDTDAIQAKIELQDKEKELLQKLLDLKKPLKKLAEDVANAEADAARQLNALTKDNVEMVKERQAWLRDEIKLIEEEIRDNKETIEEEKRLIAKRTNDLEKELKEQLRDDIAVIEGSIGFAKRKELFERKEAEKKQIAFEKTATFKLLEERKELTEKAEKQRGLTRSITNIKIEQIDRKLTEIQKKALEDIAKLEKEFSSKVTVLKEQENVKILKLDAELNDALRSEKERHEIEIQELNTATFQNIIDLNAILDIAIEEKNEKVIAGEKAVAEEVERLNTELTALRKEGFDKNTKAAATFSNTAKQAMEVTNEKTLTLQESIEGLNVKLSQSVNLYRDLFNLGVSFGNNFIGPPSPFFIGPPSPFNTPPSFADGTPSVPEDMIAQIHKGERIITAQENSILTSILGNGSPTLSAGNAAGGLSTVGGFTFDTAQIASNLVLAIEQAIDKTVFDFADIDISAFGAGVIGEVKGKLSDVALGAEPAQKEIKRLKATILELQPLPTGRSIFERTAEIRLLIEEQQAVIDTALKGVQSELFDPSTGIIVQEQSRVAGVIADDNKRIAKELQDAADAAAIIEAVQNQKKANFRQSFLDKIFDLEADSQAKLDAQKQAALNKAIELGADDAEVREFFRLKQAELDEKAAQEGLDLRKSFADKLFNLTATQEEKTTQLINREREKALKDFIASRGATAEAKSAILLELLSGNQDALKTIYGETILDISANAAEAQDVIDNIFAISTERFNQLEEEKTTKLREERKKRLDIEEAAFQAILDFEQSFVDKIAEFKIKDDPYAQLQRQRTKALAEAVAIGADTSETSAIEEFFELKRQEFYDKDAAKLLEAENKKLKIRFSFFDKIFEMEATEQEKLDKLRAKALLTIEGDKLGTLKANELFDLKQTELDKKIATKKSDLRQSFLDKLFNLTATNIQKINEEERKAIDQAKEIGAEISEIEAFYAEKRLRIEEDLMAKREKLVMSTQERIKEIQQAFLPKAEVGGLLKSEIIAELEGTRGLEGDELYDALIKIRAKLVSFFDIVKATPSFDLVGEQSFVVGLLKTIENLFAGNAPVAPSFAAGSDFIPNNMLANVHQGEAVLTAGLNEKLNNFLNTMRFQQGMDSKLATGAGVNISFASNLSFEFPNSIIVGQEGFEEFVDQKIQPILAESLENHRGQFIRKIEQKFGDRF